MLSTELVVGYLPYSYYHSAVIKIVIVSNSIWLYLHGSRTLVCIVISKGFINPIFFYFHLLTSSVVWIDLKNNQ
jgi:hypothetical protein